MRSDLARLARRIDDEARPQRPDWQRALRALRNLLADPDSTQHAFEVSYALDGDIRETRLLRMLRHPEGRRLYFERPSLMRMVCDREGLARMPEGSFGRAYLDYLETNGYDPKKLSDLRKRTDPVQGRDAGSEWFAERSDLLHDLWHVLSGYGTDGAGEAALLPFSLAQYGGRSNVLLSFGAALEGWRVMRPPGWFRYLWKAWRRGRSAALLDALPYEELLPLPLDEVRRVAGIEAPEAVHRQGVIVMPADVQEAR